MTIAQITRLAVRQAQIEPVGMTESTLERATILVVSEQQDVLGAAEQVLANQRFVIRCCSSVTDALDAMRKEYINVLLVDLWTTKMTTKSLLERAFKQSPETTRILLTKLEEKDKAFDLVTDGLANYIITIPWDDVEMTTLVLQAAHLNEELSDRHLRNFLVTLNNLPSPPRFQQRIFEILESPDSSLNDLVPEIEHNPAFVAKVLQVANSVYFGSRHRIANVYDAVLFIGMEYIGRLLMSIEVFQNFMNHVDLSVRFRVEQLWEEALVRAPLARKVAHDWKEGSVDPNSAYVASLLQDVGLLVRLAAQPDRYESFVELWKTEDISMNEADIRSFAIPHERVGATLLDLWNFPLEIVTAIRHHHGNVDGNKLTAVLQIAEGLSATSHNSRHDARIDPLIDQWKALIQR